MIKKIVNRVAEGSSCQFELVNNIDESILFYRSGISTHQRFLVVLDTDELSSPSELNAKVQEITPQAFHKMPSFAKNTDLILLYRLENINNLYLFENQIFDIEENAYSLKKHVLYYTERELEQLNSYLDTGENLETLIKDPDLFNEYKNNPIQETAFSLACRIYVKLPFLEVPAKESNLIDPNEIAEKFLSNKNLSEFFNSIQKQVNDGNEYDSIMEALINEQMAD